MFIPKAKDLHTISKQNHRGKRLSVLFNAQKPKKDNFVKEFNSALSITLGRIKTAILCGSKNYVFYFYRGDNEAQCQRMLKALTKVFTAYGYEVEQSDKHLKIIW